MATNIWPEDILAKTMTADAIVLLARYLDPREAGVQMLCNENNLLCCAVVQNCTMREHNQMWYMSSKCDYRRVLSVLFASGQTAYAVRWAGYWRAVDAGNDGFAQFYIQQRFVITVHSGRMRTISFGSSKPE